MTASLPERRIASATFGISVMVGPVLGPVLGGWLTENISWRWVFYINLPLGILALAGVSIFVTETKGSALAKLDWVGFGALSIAIGALQLFLDRGAQLDWFDSLEQSRIEWREADGHVIMTGPAQVDFTGNLP